MNGDQQGNLQPLNHIVHRNRSPTVAGLAKRTWQKSRGLVANVSMTEKWGLGGGVSKAGQFLRHTADSGAVPLPVPSPLYQVPVTVSCRLPQWVLAQKPLPSPFLVLPASRMVEGHRYSYLAGTLAHFVGNYRVLGQGL